MYKINAKIAEIGSTISIGEKGFTKRIVILETDAKYPQFIQIEFQKADTSLLDDFDTGQNVTVSFNINGRKWISPDGEVKYFNTLQGWKIESVDKKENKPPVVYSDPIKEESFNPDDGDLPF